MTQANANFSINNLPEIVPDSNGIAKPKPGVDVAVCIAPADAKMPRPASWGDGDALDIKVGQHCIGLGGGDNYPNAEFTRDYNVSGDLPLDDPRAAELVAFWANQGHTITSVQLASKTRHAIVIGETVGEGMFETAEGPAHFTAGAKILQSPVDSSYVWVVEPKTFAKRYQEVEKS